MFDRRVKLLLIFLSLPVLAVIGRLFQLQVMGASTYREQTENMLKRPPRQTPCLRGSILDRAGRILAHDAPAWDISVQYGAMVDDPGARKRMCSSLGIPPAELSDELIDESWRRMAQLTARPLSDLRSEADRIVSVVRRIKRTVSERRGVEMVILEERQPHPVVRGLDRGQQVAARVALAQYPWIEITSSQSRVYAGGAAIGQVLGQLGRVTPEVLANDPHTDDHLACYQADESYGILGVERLAEQWLRGRRGEEYFDRLGVQVRPPLAPQDGRDVRLTIDLALQEAIYRIWTRSSIGMGGAAVILDIPTRQVLAMVGYPAVDPNNREDIRRVDPDDPRRPFLFRAVRGNYPPGSIVKPMILAAGMSERCVGKHDTVNCMGKLFAESPKWKCEGVHPGIAAIEAVQKSCNVYFYRLGQQLGVEREARWMGLFGMGRPSGIGLVEDFRGRLPSTRSDGEARQAAIGQSETEITPIQAANLIASIADGVYRPVTLWADNPDPHPPGQVLPVSDFVWQTVREGIFDAVNLPKGTAYKTAGQANFGPYVLVGKTGSAETGPAEYIYPVTLADGTRREVRAADARAVRRRYPDAVKIDVENRREPPEYNHTHSWFVGYLAPRGRHLQAVGPGPASIAIAVIVEYGGHGGEVAAPMTVEMLQAYLMLQQAYSAQANAGRAD